MTRGGWRKYATEAESFEAKIDKSGDCWLWMAGKSERGYGRFNRTEGRGVVIAHRFAYELFVGPIPDGMTIDHLCRTPACVKPEHLEPVTFFENQARRPELTHCPQGHEFTPENTYLYGHGKAVDRPARHCKTCNRERARRRAAAKRAAA